MKLVLTFVGAALASLALSACGSSSKRSAIRTTASTPSTIGALTFNADFATARISPWNSAQCAEYRTPSSGHHQRGDLYFDRAIVGKSRYSVRIDLPVNIRPYTTTVCELLHRAPLGDGSDQYYGDMVYVPVGWTPGTHAFWGVEIAQWHFENIWGPPIGFQLHPDHLTLAIETGPCRTPATRHPSCRYRSNADNGHATNLPGYYVIPPNAFQPGRWYEIIMHVHWATNRSGSVQTWYRVKGTTNWTPTADVAGIPTLQWTAGQSPPPDVVDKVGAYRGYSIAPTSVWLDNVAIGTGFRSVAATMP